MKALQIILNCFVLIVISAPFISKTLFKRQALGYFGSWSPVLGLKKKKIHKKFPVWNAALLKEMWKMHSPAACHRFFRVAGATFQGQWVQLIPSSRGYSPITPLGNHSDIKRRIREEDHTSVFLAGKRGAAGVWESATGTIPGHPSSGTARKTPPSSKPAPGCRHRFIFQ